MQNGKITTITNTNIPLGLVKNSDYIPIAKKLEDGAIIVQITDGVVPDTMNTTDNFLTNYLKNLDLTTKNVRTIGDEIHKLVLKENKGILNDDITIIVSKIIKSRK